MSIRQTFITVGWAAAGWYIGGLVPRADKIKVSTIILLILVGLCWPKENNV